MDVEDLLQERADAPSGEDMEYDPVFTELEIAATPGEERQVGDEIIAAEDPDYKEVTTKALEVMERSHDLRAGVFLAEAQLRLNGLPGFSKAVSYLRGCLEQHWASCHPQLDAEDDDDPTMRVNAVLALADDARILRGLRRAPMTESRMFGMITLREISVAEGEMTAPSDMDNVPDTGAIAAAFQDTDAERLGEFSAAASQALEDVEVIVSCFDTNTPGQGPDLDPLIKVIKQIRGHLSKVTGGDAAVETASDGDDAAPSMTATTAAPGPSGGGAINSPTDVVNALERIMGYYERCEPSSPVPILLNRAKLLVNADFLTIMKNMAPQGVDNVNLIAGIEEDDDY